MSKILKKFDKKKEVPKTQIEKFKQMELQNPNIRLLAETFDLVIKI